MSVSITRLSPTTSTERSSPPYEVGLELTVVVAKRTLSTTAVANEPTKERRDSVSSLDSVTVVVAGEAQRRVGKVDAKKTDSTIAVLKAPISTRGRSDSRTAVYRAK